MSSKMMTIRLKNINDVKAFNEAALLCNGEMYIRQGRYVVDAKSIMGIFSLNLLEDLYLEIYEHENGESLDFVETIKKLGIIK